MCQQCFVDAGIEDFARAIQNPETFTAFLKPDEVDGSDTWEKFLCCRQPPWPRQLPGPQDNRGQGSRPTPPLGLPASPQLVPVRLAETEVQLLSDRVEGLEARVKELEEIVKELKGNCRP